MLRPNLPIDTERLRLRAYVATDLDDLLAVQSDAGVARYLYYEPRSRPEVEEALALRMAAVVLEAEDEALTLAVERRDAGAYVGEVTLFWRSVEHRRGEIGFVLHPAHRGHGYAAEAAEALLRLGFEELGLRRIVGRLDARNTASARVLEKLAMRLEAHFVENELVKGEWADELVYALLEREWRART